MDTLAVANLNFKLRSSHDCVFCPCPQFLGLSLPSYQPARCVEVKQPKHLGNPRAPLRQSYAPHDQVNGLLRRILLGLRGAGKRKWRDGEREREREKKQATVNSGHTADYSRFLLLQK